MFDDDDIHIPLERQISIGTTKSLYHVGTIKSNNNPLYDHQEQDAVIEDEDAYPQFDDDENNDHSDNSFSRAQPEQFEVIEEEDE